MATIRVWNDNVHPYREEFRGQQIYIKPKSYILMEEDEAKIFKGSFVSIQTDADGNPIPEGYKMIRLEKSADTNEEVETEPETPKCHACGYESAGGKDLFEHITAEHKEQIFKDENIEKELAKKKKRKAS